MCYYSSHRDLYPARMAVMWWQSLTHGPVAPWGVPPTSHGGHGLVIRPRPRHLDGCGGRALFRVRDFHSRNLPRGRTSCPTRRKRHPFDGTWDELRFAMETRVLAITQVLVLRGFYLSAHTHSNHIFFRDTQRRTHSGKSGATALALLIAEECPHIALPENGQRQRIRNSSSTEEIARTSSSEGGGSISWCRLSSQPALCAYRLSGKMS